MSARVELLLAFLSLLSAATGAFTGARAPEAGVHQTAQVDTIRTAAPRAVAAVRAVMNPSPAPTLIVLAAYHSAPAAIVAPAVPLYADRLIE